MTRARGGLDDVRVAGWDLGDSPLATFGESQARTTSDAWAGDATAPFLLIGASASRASAHHPTRVSHWLASLPQAPATTTAAAPQAPASPDSAAAGAALLAPLLTPAAHQVAAVPACWGDFQRQLALDALRIAGASRRQITLCSRHVAAAASVLQDEWIPSDNVESLCLVLSLGDSGGEAALLEIEGRGIRTLKLECDKSLVASRWEDRFIEQLAEAFQERHGIDPLGDRQKRDAWKESLRPTARDALERLEERGGVECEAAFQQTLLRTAVTRPQWRVAADDLSQRFAELTGRLRQATPLLWPQIRTVILCGRARWFGRWSKLEAPPQSRWLHVSTQAVARGARWCGGPDAPLAVQDLNPRGLELHVRKGERLSLIAAGEAMPKLAKRQFRLSRDGRQSVHVPLCETTPEDGSLKLRLPSSDAGPSVECRVFGLPSNLPRNTPLSVEVGFDAEGRIAAGAAGLESGAAVSAEIVRRYELTDKQVAESQRHLRP